MPIIWILPDLQKTKFKVCSAYYSLFATADLHGPTKAMFGPDAATNSASSTSGWEMTVSASNRLPNIPGAVPNARRMSNPQDIWPATQQLALDTRAVGGDCVISLLSPSCGATSGGEQIVLVVVNLPPSTTFFARFGDIVVSTVRRK